MIRSRWLALVVLSAGSLMIILSETIVNVALRSIQRDLDFSGPGLAWIVNAYLIAFGGLLLLAGRLGDLLGSKRVFLAGLSLFTVMSLLCGLAQSRWLLVTARFAQGIGAALTSAVVLGMIVTLFPEPGLRARAFGVYSFVGAAGASIGVLGGGVITQALSWHWVFFVNVLIGITTLALATRVLESRPGIGLRDGADVAGASLVTVGLMTGVYAIVETDRYGWGSAHTLGLGLLAVLLLAGFVVRQSRAATPLLPLRVLRSRSVSVANLVQALMVAGMFGFQFLVALYLQRVLHYRPAQTGLAFLPITVVIAAVSLGVAARLIGRWGTRAVLLAGLGFLALGLAVLARAPVHGHYAADILPSMLLLGVGAGLALPAVTTLAMSGATDGRSGSVSGIVSGLTNTTQQVGGALGVAVLTTLATARGAGGSAADLTAGYRLAFGIAAGLVLAAAVLTVLLLHAGATQPVTPAREPQPSER